MPVTDWAKPTTATSGTWTYYTTSLPEDIYTQDVTSPTYSWAAPHDYVAAPSGPTDILTIGGFETSVGVPLDIPTGAEVIGIECIMTAAAYGASGVVECDPPDEFGNQTCYYPALSAYASKDGVNSVGTKHTQNLNYAGLDFTFGGNTDLWGTTWTEAEVEGIYFRVFSEGDETPASGRRLDYYWVRVWYEETITPPDPGVLLEATTKYMPGLSVQGNPSTVVR